MSSKLISGIRNLVLLLLGLFASGHLLLSLLPIGFSGDRVPSVRLVVDVPEAMTRRHAFLNVETVAEEIGIPPSGERFLETPELTQMLRTGATFESPEKYRDDYGMMVQWDREAEEISSLLIVFRHRYGEPRFGLDEWTLFRNLRDEMIPRAFPGARITVERHPAVFTDSWNLRSFSEHFDEPLPEREATRLHCWEQLSGFQQFLRRDLGYGVGAPEHWVLEQARKRVERTTGLDLLAWTDTPASQRCGGHQLDQINLLAYGVGLAFVLPLFWLIWRLAGLARAGLGERRVLFVTIGTLLLMPVGLPLDLNWYWVPQIVAMWHLHSRDYALFMDWLNFEYNLYFTLAVFLSLLLVAWTFRERASGQDAPADQGGS